VRDTAGFDDVPEQVEVRKIEAHGATFLFCEGRLRRKHFATAYFRVQASPIMK
jgi:hypothetical protein